ncbi:NAD(P)H-dependent flavin oxidoreductase [Lacticaseibacillus nasuensis]|uniref:NAD(P)H-dependent flavin oxidoreductase n=1 Tax=Lacticaseibacillus nasuensis TaxID=944671 RepID=UPI002247EE06|nr:nitronate monooxygenase [Lacticaseibacillus nasuensis]MCX2455699.1 nitronate monooxygenase [Lacticaseibacillus nasuensis]
MTTQLGTRLPLIQGALAQISLPPLVSAVSNAGGLGVLTTVGLTPATLAAAIAAVQAATTQPFGVNLMLQQPNVAELVPYLLAHPVPVVTTSAGSPKRFAAALQAVGTKVVAVIPNVTVARKMAALGVDAVVAEGMESGGHIGTETTMSLVQQVTAAVDLPVYAAGGICDARGVAAATALGAVGVQVGTAWLAASETPISDAYKRAVVAASDTATVVTGRRLGDAVRSLANPLTAEYLAAEADGASVASLHQIVDGSLTRAVAGDVDHGTLMAGQIAGAITAIEPVTAIVARLFPA